MPGPDLSVVERESVIEHLDARKQEAANDFWFGVTERTELLSAYGTAQRKRDLLNYYRHDYNGMVQGAFSGMTKKWAGIGRRLKGTRKRDYFEDVFKRAHFGKGWEQFVQMVGLDFLRFDDGAYIELVYPGSPLRAPTGALIGINHLSNLRCVPTGDPEFPVLYVDRKNKKHLLHHTRVIHLIDSPDGDDSFPDYGLSALSRAISIVVPQIYMNRYVSESLDDKPMPGMVVASNINEKQRDAAFRAYRAETSGDVLPVSGKTVWFYSVDPTAPAKIEVVSFAQAPADFNYQQYTEIHVNALALALGADVQELWQLTGGTLGSGQQSMVLHAKSQNKTFAAFLNALQPKLDAALPDYQEFEFVVRDPYAVQDEALAFQGWTGGLATAGPDTLSPDEKRQLLANAIPMVRDVIGTASGGVTAAPPPMDVEAPGTTPGSTGPRADAENPRRMAKPQRTQGERKEADEKAIQSTRLTFEAAFEDLVAAARAGDMDRRRFGIILRDLLRKGGMDAFKDGLQDGGVEDAQLDMEDSATYTALLAAQSRYVTAFGKTLFEDGITDAEADNKAALWYTKSVQPFYDAGRLSADANGMYRFVGDDGIESCDTCKRLLSQQHRMKDWTRKQMRPGVDTEAYDCRGYACKHRLVRATGRAVGRF